MSEMKVFKVTLEAKDWFFFGGDSTFDNGTKTSYIAHSMLLPQQTALLGMIRYQLLKQNSLLFGEGGSPEKREVKELIGEKSFIMNDNDQISFGDILGISPVFLEEYDNKNKDVVRNLFPLSLTNSYNLSFNDNVRVYLTDKEKRVVIEDNNSFIAEKYNNYIKYVDKDGRSISTDVIFEKRMQVGITKNTDYNLEKGKKDGKFFKHEMVSFRKMKDRNTSFRYAFYVKLNNENLKSDFVFLGAERSCFEMLVSLVDYSDLKQVYLQNHPSKQVQGRIEILSPTYVEDIDELEDLCDFHWSFVTTFRNITYSKEGRLSNGNVSYNRGSTSYNMLCSGSVLFFDESKRKMIEDLLNNEHLHSIGYNYYNSMK